MKNRRVLAVLLAVAVMLAMMPAMAFADTTAPAPETAPTAPAKSNDIVILGTSDVHCGIDQNIGYAGLAAGTRKRYAAFGYAGYFVAEVRGSAGGLKSGLLRLYKG